MTEPRELSGYWRCQGTDDLLRDAFARHAEREETAGRPLPSVELNRAVQLWLQRQGWRLQFDPMEIVANNLFGVHPEVGEVMVQVFLENAGDWEREASDGLHTALPVVIEALNSVRKGQWDDHCSAAAVVANRTTGEAWVEAFSAEQLNRL